MKYSRQNTSYTYGDNLHFKQALNFELGENGFVDYAKALINYRKGAKEKHFLSVLKVRQTKPRIATFYPLISIALIALIVGLLVNQLWVGFLFLSVALTLLYWLDRDYYWYKPGWPSQINQIGFYLGLTIFLPLSAVLPYLNGVTYFPLIGLFVIGLFVAATGVILFIQIRNKNHVMLSLYGLGLFGFSLFAYTIPSEDIKFSYLESNGVVQITDYRSSDTEVVIPKNLNNLPVTSIASYAFASTPIKSIYIGNHITNIEAFAFAF